MDLLEQTKVGRDINRHHYGWDEVQEALQRLVIQDLLKLIRFRNEHPAFQGTFSLLESDNYSLVIRWDYAELWAQLAIDFMKSAIEIYYFEDRVEKRLM